MREGQGGVYTISRGVDFKFEFNEGNVCLIKRDSRIGNWDLF